MATYIVGDVQGCLASLLALLRKVRFGADDVLWCVGDLVNRGPDSLATLRFAHALGERFEMVLGNHDLHFLALVYGGHRQRSGDTLGDLLAAPDCLQLADWLRRQPLLAEGESWAMVHAGIPHIWSLDDARARAREVERVLQGPGHRAFFRAMYGNEPALWKDDLEGLARHRAIVNYFTRMRLVDARGRMELTHKGALRDVPAGYRPWFGYPSRLDRTLYFGHWAALDGETGSSRLIGLDTGCVWGRAMTAVRAEDGAVFSVPAAPRDRPALRQPSASAVLSAGASGA